METRLQSSEVRLPKSPQSPISACPTFKSSFARSLSFSTNQHKPLDLEISFRIAQATDGAHNNNNNNTSSPSCTPPKSDDVDDDFEEFMRNSPLKQSMHTMNLNKTSPAATTTPPTRNPIASPRISSPFCSVRQRLQDSHANKLCTAEIEVLRLRKECQNLLEENRRLAHGNGSPNDNFDDMLMPSSTNGGTVEETVLQTQIETLQWQLNQVESSRQMYHAVMEEVARFLERCYQSVETITKNSQMARSRSVNQMFVDQSQPQPNQPSSSQHTNGHAGNGTNKNYHRSSTNSFDKSHSSTTTTMATGTQQLNESFTSTSTANTTNSNDAYNAFTDFTWRRSPKKTPQKGSADDEAEKLAQEAFRLYRTTQNLLNLKEPILSEPKTLQSFHRNSLSDLKSSSGTLPLSFAPASLQRKLKSRESRISCQSISTSDGSVHSNSSSSRHETDEEAQVANGTLCNGNSQHRRISTGNARFNLNREMDALAIGKDRVKSVASNSADDESGFSSMNSFHHENIAALLPPPPLNSTMISNQFLMDANEDAMSKGSTAIDDMHKIENHLENSIFSCGPMPDIKASLPIMHKRWESAPPIPPKKNLATFNTLKTPTNGEDKKSGIHVLWV